MFTSVKEIALVGALLVPGLLAWSASGNVVEARTAYVLAKATADLASDPVPVTAKGDLQRPAAAQCAGRNWPGVETECLVSSDPIRQVRTVTVEHRVGEAVSVLVRLPADQIASR